jgi:hypothetical protein
MSAEFFCDCGTVAGSSTHVRRDVLVHNLCDRVVKCDLGAHPHAAEYAVGDLFTCERHHTAAVSMIDDERVDLDVDTDE